MKLAGKHAPLSGDRRSGIWSHVRLKFIPTACGAAARLRRGRARWSQRGGDTLYDLAAIENGGPSGGVEDAHFGNPIHLLAPGRGENMGDGWETRRRASRERLGGDRAGLARNHPQIEVDTAISRATIRPLLAAGPNASNVPDEALVTQSMFWRCCCPNSGCRGRCPRFRRQIADLGAITHVRFNIIPDGGVSGCGLWGQVSPVRR